MNIWRYILLLFLGVSSAHTLFALTGPCDEGASNAIYQSVVQSPGTVRANDESKENLHLVYVTFAALVAIQQCPDQSEAWLKTAQQTENGREVDNGQEATNWIKDLPQLLQFPPLRGITFDVPCKKSTPLMCAISTTLKAAAQPRPNQPQKFSCARFGRRFIQGIGADYQQWKGDELSFGIIRTLAFGLSVCPEAFFRYMHEHPSDLESWMGRMQSLFRGDANWASNLGQFRQDLIQRVESYRTASFAKERKIVLDALRRTRVSIIN